MSLDQRSSTGLAAPLSGVSERLLLLGRIQFPAVAGLGSFPGRGQRRLALRLRGRLLTVGPSPLRQQGHVRSLSRSESLSPLGHLPKVRSAGLGAS